MYRSSRLLVLLDAHVENVDILTGMYSAYMRPHVRRVFRTVRTIRTIESRQLAALELEMIIQIVLARERVAALVARVIPALLRPIGIVDALIGMRVKSLHGRQNLWEQKISPRNSGRKLGMKQLYRNFVASRIEKKEMTKQSVFSADAHFHFFLSHP